MRRALIWLIDGYRLLLSPLLGTNCRFHPSCSCYAREALQVHGTSKGLTLGIRRISRCHPWNSGGYDPVPPVTRLSADLSSSALNDIHG